MTDSRNHDPADALAAMTSGAVRQDVEPRDAGDVGDDFMAAPAPDPSVFAPRRRPTRHLLTERQIHARRTLIPVLLTCGVLMPLVGSLKWLRGVGSPFAAWPIWPPIVLSACGVALLALAVANMMQVRQLSRRTPPPLPREITPAARGLTR